VCFAVELDPRYVDVAVRRWQAFTGKKATLLSNGGLFNDIPPSPQPSET
jgi:DNA modification methylase